MHELTRQVRFSINPFLPEDNEGFSSFASNPVEEGLSVFLELSVELAGEVDSATGFVLNVTDIDKAVRRFVIPIWTARLRADCQCGKSVGVFTLAEFLRSAWDYLADKFDTARLSKLSVKLDPFRDLAIDSKESEMVYFSEKFEFAAAHKLWNDQFAQGHNFEVFGKCAHPSGHGHNYVVEVTIKKPAGENDFRIGDFERIVNDQLVEILDHKNLNVDIAEFGRVNPTVENIAAFAWNKLVGKVKGASLHCITVWETDKTRCSYYGG
jgi:6-pyruvoyltetrahydropterin/6-carboxytetrahydropterin synthase